MVVGATWLRPQGHAASPNHTHTRHTQPLGGWHIPPSPSSAPSLVHMLRKWLRLLWHRRLLLLRLSFVVLHVVVPIIVRAVHYFEPIVVVVIATAARCRLRLRGLRA